MRWTLRGKDPADARSPSKSDGRPASGDRGFSLIEVLVAIAVIGTVMTAMAPFLVQSLAVSDQQRSEQMAIQVANDALERVRALDPSSLLTGRSAQETARQWTDPNAPTALTAYLADMQQASDPLLPLSSTSGPEAPLPTVPYALTVNGIEYEQQWYIGLCWQTKATATQPDIGDCRKTGTEVPFYRVVVAVTWQHRSCPGGSCVYIASALVSSGADPIFDAAPTITDPGNQSDYTDTAVSFQLSSSVGQLTWSAVGLPPGLSISTSGLITGTPTDPGSYSVVATVIDQDAQTDESSFTWTVVEPPALTGQGDQTSLVGAAVTLSLSAIGGKPPLVWSASGLPAGLTINASTGAISGTPTTPQSLTTTVTITDAGTPARTASVSFGWSVLTPTPVQLTNPGTQTVKNGDSVPLNLSDFASGGLPPYTWWAENLPDGLSINPATGVVEGMTTRGTRYIATVRVTDSGGGQSSTSVVFIVTQKNANDLRVTSPTPAGPDRSTPVGLPVSLNAAAAGTNQGSYEWSATNLPTGLAISAAGEVRGTPTARGTYRVTLTVKRVNGNETANLMFDWSVT